MFPFIFLCFFGSGCAALVYEIVWFQLLEFVIGSTAVSMAVLLGTFMGGMCLGSLALPRLVKPRWHPLRVCAWLELGIGASGLAVLAGMPAIVRFFAEGSLQGQAGIFARGAACALCLLPPTVLMGATLPAISRWIENTPIGISRLGFFYCGNTLGAVFGSLLAGFYLLRVHDMPSATLTAAAINLLAALLGFGLAAKSPQSARSSPSDLDPGLAIDAGGAPTQTWTVHLALALSGMSALGAEVVWTRLLSLNLGPTVYTFSIILAVFLLGIGLGGSAGAWLTRSLDRPRLDCFCGDPLSALLAHPRVDGSQSMAPIQLRFSPLPARHPPGGLALGREFPPGAGVHRSPRQGNRKMRRGRVRGQYGGGDRRGHRL
jgi:spermidine synthase